ncbi:MAG: molybdate ABC transporter substrate-binding protein [Pseudolysinimonas sp.]
MKRSHAVATGVVLALLTGCAPAGTDGVGPGSEGNGTEILDPATGTITVFAAASLTEVFGVLETKFEERHPSADVVLSFGGSGSLATQIVEGAPADVFAAASEAPMATVTDAGDAADSAVFTTNTLEIAVPAGNPAGVEGLADLADPALAIALCDPSVPCGAATETLMHLAGLLPSPDTLEQDVKAVLTKVELGEADAGLVYVTDVISAGPKVEGIPVPEAAAVISRYPIAVLTGAPNPAAARAWLDFVLSDDGQAALTAAGFVAP